MTKPKPKFHQYMMVKDLTEVKFAPDSKTMFFIDNTRGVYDLWSQRYPGEAPQQLTRSTHWTPRQFVVGKNGEYLFLMADYQGNENFQIFQLPHSGGIPRRITKESDKRFMLVKNGQLDANTLLVSTTAFGPSGDIAKLNLSDGSLEQLTKNDSNMFGAAVSPDGQNLVVVEFLNNSDTNLFLYELTNGLMTQLISKNEEAVLQFECWDPDSSGFYFRSNYKREFMAGAYYNLTDRSWEWLDDLQPNWNVESIDVSEDGRWLAFTVNEAGNGKLHLLNRESGEDVTPEVFTRTGLVRLLGFTKDSSKLYYYFESSKKVKDAHVFDIETGKEVVMTKNMIGGIDDEVMVSPELVKVKSSDGVEISAWLYKPHNLSGGTKAPILLSIHGGPESQERVEYRYRGLYQILLSLGIGVLAPNIRGSTGYGKAFQKAIYRDWGGKDLQDIEACAQFMQQISWVDKDRLGVFGGSYGGFATLSAVSRLPVYWKIGVDLVGPSNLISFVQSVPEFWKASGAMKKWVGDPVEDKELLESRSPINYIEQITADLFIAQGANDPRVVKAESDQIVEKLREMGRHVEYRVWEDEGHGFVKTENYEEFLRLAVQFMHERFFGEELTLDETIF